MSISLFQIPKPIEEQMKQLNELVEAHPLHLPLSKVARLLGTKDESLRAAIDCGNFSPGYSWRKGGALNKGYSNRSVLSLVHPIRNPCRID